MDKEAIKDFLDEELDNNPEAIIILSVSQDGRLEAAYETQTTADAIYILMMAAIHARLNLDIDDDVVDKVIKKVEADCDRFVNKLPK